MNETRTNLLRTLADGRVYSGESLGAQLGVSRAAVSKSLRSLVEMGLALNQRPGRGYWLDQPLDLLDQQRIQRALGKSAAARIDPLQIELAVTSTNDLLRQSAAPREPKFRALLAEYQSAGRGRQGKSWQAPLGGALLLSMAQQVTGGVGRVAGLSLVIGVAIRRALADAGIEDIRLKWPNDVYHADRKLAGVLVELDGDIGGSCQWVAGIGLNCRLGDNPGVDQPWTDLSRLSESPPDRSRLAGVLLQQLVTAVDQLACDGLPGLLDEWRDADLLRGRDIAIVSPGAQTLSGVAAGVDEAGALLLKTSAGTQRVNAGSVEMRS